MPFTEIVPRNEEIGATFRSRGLVHEIQITEHPENPPGQRWLVYLWSAGGSAWLSEEEARGLAEILPLEQVIRRAKAEALREYAEERIKQDPTATGEAYRLRIHAERLTWGEVP